MGSQVPQFRAQNYSYIVSTHAARGRDPRVGVLGKRSLQGEYEHLYNLIPSYDCESIIASGKSLFTSGFITQSDNRTKLIDEWDLGTQQLLN